MGIPADVFRAVDLWWHDAEGWWALVVGFVFSGSFGFSWPSVWFTETVEEGGRWVDVEGLELQCEAPAVLLGQGKRLPFVEVENNECPIGAPFWRGGGSGSCLDCPILWL